MKWKKEEMEQEAMYERKLANGFETLRGLLEVVGVVGFVKD